MNTLLREVVADALPAGEKYDDVLRPFLSMMRKELHANAGKGDRPGWLSMDRKTALLELYYHLSKLQKAMNDDNAEAIREYGADVANMAMMAVDVCGQLDVLPTPEASAGVEERAREVSYWRACYESECRAKLIAIGHAFNTADMMTQSYLAERDQRIAAALRTPAKTEGDVGRVDESCCECNSPVDTRENGSPGAELADGRWVCSDACWARATADAPSAQQEALAVDDAMAKDPEAGHGQT